MELKGLLSYQMNEWTDKWMNEQVSESINELLFDWMADYWVDQLWSLWIENDS